MPCATLDEGWLADGVADAFCTRLEPERGLAFGTLPSGVDARAVAEPARPRL